MNVLNSGCVSISALLVERKVESTRLTISCQMGPICIVLAELHVGCTLFDRSQTIPADSSTSYGTVGTLDYPSKKNSIRFIACLYQPAFTINIFVCSCSYRSIINMCGITGDGCSGCPSLLAFGVCVCFILLFLELFLPLLLWLSKYVLVLFVLFVNILFDICFWLFQSSQVYFDHTLILFQTWLCIYVLKHI